MVILMITVLLDTKDHVSVILYDHACNHDDMLEMTDCCGI
jgi:hypothetical protein